MTVAAIVLIALGALSLGLNLWQWFAGWRFPMRQRKPSAADSPGISVLKPLKGTDAETARCLESWFLQEYAGEWELLFGVASSDDPVGPIVRRFCAKYPCVKADLILAAPALGSNGKVSSLCYMSRKARHDLFVVSDADVFAEKDFLSTLAAEMSDKSVGLVNCFYILADPSNLAMRLEAIAVNADFWTQVLQALDLRKMNFALGAVVASRRGAVEVIGGFEGLVDLLADDYELGKRVAQTGQKLVVCPVPVECRTEEQDAAAVWQHQLRWARTIRVSQPIGYFFSVLGNGTVWPLLAGFTGTNVGWSILVSGLALRMLGAVSNYRRLTGRLEWWVAPLALLKDFAQLALWAVSFCGNRIIWRGQRFRVSRGGKLTPSA